MLGPPSARSPDLLQGVASALLRRVDLIQVRLRFSGHAEEFNERHIAWPFTPPAMLDRPLELGDHLRQPASEQRPPWQASGDLRDVPVELIERVELGL